MEDGMLEADPAVPDFGPEEFDRMATAVTALCAAEDAAEVA